MRRCAIGGVLCLAFWAAIGRGGDAPKVAPFREASVEDTQALMGDWQAAVHTKDGWTGTLRGNVSLQRNHPEGSIFHAVLALRYDLKLADHKPAVVVAGTRTIALLPVRQGKHRLLQCLSDVQVLQMAFFEEILDRNPKDQNARAALAKMRPSRHNTATSTRAAGTWTLEVAPSVRDVLPKGGATGPPIDWDQHIVWKKLKAK